MTSLRVVHLPVYRENPYQKMLMGALANQSIEVIEGGGGGNFFRTALKKWHSDVLHFHWLHPYLLRDSFFKTLLRSVRFLAEIALLKINGSQIVWTIHNLKNHDNRFLGLERAFSTGFAKLCSGFIVHSSEAKKLAMETFRISDEWRVSVVPHGNYVDCYPNEITPAKAREALGIPSDHPVLLFLGRIHPYKGVIDLVNAFKSLKSNATLIIAGKPVDEDASSLISREINGARGIIYRPGFVPDREIQVYMNACDVVVFPYREILTSGAVVLAMSFGCACVVPRIASLTEFLDERGAIFFDPKSTESLQAALAKACEGKPNAAAMGKHNLQLARQWDWQRVGEMTKAVYTTCLAAKL
ncbi:MAG: glycosyltransferase family 4 protein [Acidobacteriota bacterium]